MEVLNDQVISGTIDVSVGELMQGTGEIHVTLEIRDEGLLFSYKTKSLLNNLSPRQDITIPYGQLSKAELKRGVLSPKILLRPRHFEIMDDIPGESRSHVIFKVKWGERSFAEGFVMRLQFKIYEAEESLVDSVPFQLSSTSMGLLEHSGLLYMDEEFLVFDIHSGISGVSKGDWQQIKIEPAAIQSIRLDTGVRNDTLFVRPKTDALLEAVPGNHDDELKLSIKRRYRKTLERLVMLVSNS